MKVLTGAFQALRLGPKVTTSRRLASHPNRRLLVPCFQSHAVSGCTDSTTKSTRNNPPASQPPAAAAATSSTSRTTVPRRACPSSNCLAAATAVFNRVVSLVSFRSFRLPHGPAKQQSLPGVNAAGGASVSGSKIGEAKAAKAVPSPPSGYRSAQMHFPFGLGIYGAAGLHAVDEPKISFSASTSSEPSSPKRPGSPKRGGVARS
ncbi:hypothetical protein Emed_004050 [Eimeria media]